MSRIGKKIINIPKEVSITINDRNILVKGKYGSLEKSFLDYIGLKLENQQLIVLPMITNTKRAKAYYGLCRALIQNMIIGVQNNFSKILIAEGVGYKFQLEKSKLILNMGFTHPIEFIIPNDLSVKLESPTKIIISGIDKEKVGFLAAKIRDIRPPEPYKGKGILYEGEKIIRKAGKTRK
jgi:large subunit ribosomal protein L6